jgi:hypothetical protein
VEPTTVNAILSGRNGAMEAWYRASVHARDEFWRGVHRVLARLANRVSADEAAKIIAAISARIPELTEEETAAIPKWEDEALLNFWNRAENQFADLVKTDEGRIQYYEMWIARAREDIARFRSAGAEVHNGVELVQRAIMRGDRKAIKQLTEDGEQVNTHILTILGSRARTG